MSRSVRYLSMAIGLLLAAPASWACDSCSIYHSLEQRVPKAKTLHLSVTEQFTEYGKLQQGGTFVPNTFHQRLDSSQTIVSASYDFSDRLSLEGSLPYINRRYTTLDGHEVKRGTEAGIGDLTTLIMYVPYRSMEQDSSLVVQLFGGFKLPSGSASALESESEEEHVDEHEEEADEHAHSLRHGDASEGSAIHGHDLALGSGSVDVPFGAAVFVREGRFYAEANTEYTIRTEGEYNYRYANELLWRVGPAYYVVLHRDLNIATKLNLSGQYKGKDKVNGENENDTGLNAVYWGPEIIATVGENFGTFLSYDMPLEIENSGLQAVMSYRLRGGIRYRF